MSQANGTEAKSASPEKRNGGEQQEQEQQEPPAASTGTSTTNTNTANNKPRTPPANQDAHITLLVLPALERYDGSVMYGLKSRSWGSNHDGMSFKVERIEWVDEGSRRGQERGGEARRKRLKSMMRSGRICTAADMGGNSNKDKTTTKKNKNKNKTGRSGRGAVMQRRMKLGSGSGSAGAVRAMSMTGQAQAQAQAVESVS